MLENSENIPTPHKHSSTSKEFKNKVGSNPLHPSLPNSERPPVKRLGPYEFCLEQKIGSGMSGDAYVGISTETCELVCVKVVDRAVFKTTEQQRLLDNQIRCQRACSSPYTIRIFDVFDTSSFCFIITEFCEGGDLYRYLRSTPNGLPEVVVLQFGKDVALALQKVKQAGIVHRDIKSENILIQKHSCKLGDFGFAIEEKVLGQQKKSNLGSPLYMSPEALQNSEYSYASDIFSFGVVLYQMLHKESPWECSDEKELILKMKTLDPAFKSSISNELKQLISQCLSREPQNRPTIDQILQNPLFASPPNDAGTE